MNQAITSLSETEDILVRKLINKFGLNPFIQIKKTQDRLNKLNAILIYVIKYLCFRDVGRLDSAITNHLMRSTWLSHPKKLSLSCAIRLNNDSNMKWCNNRYFFLVNIIIHDLCGTISNEGIRNLLSCIQTLEELVVKEVNISSTLITKSGFLKLFKNMPKLQKLILNSCTGAVDDKVLNTIGTYCGAQLKTLQIMDCYEGIDDFSTIVLLQCCCKLTTFIFKYTNPSHHQHHHTDNGFLVITSLLQLLGTYCPLLQTLKLKGIELTPPVEEMHTFGKGCSKLQNIFLYNVDNFVSDDFLIILGTYSKLLEVLIIGDAAVNTISITNKGIQTFFKGCKYLKILSCNALLHHPITNEAFLNISSFCPQLHTFRFDYAQITDVTLKELGNLKYLKNIVLAYNHLITNKGVLQLLCDGSWHMNNNHDDDDGNNNNNNNSSSGSGNNNSNNNSNVTTVSSSSSSSSCNDTDTSTSGSSSNATNNSSSSNSNVSNDTNNTTSINTTNNNTNTAHERSKKYSALENITITLDSVKTTTFSIRNIANNCPDLQSINLMSTPHTGSTFKSLSYLINMCKQLTEIKCEAILLTPILKAELKKRKQLQRRCLM